MVTHPCLTAGTLIETANGLKPIEAIQIGDMVWSRHEETLEFGYRPVTETASFEDKQIYEVVVQDKYSKIETYQTTEEHPFWVHEFGWLPASSLMAGMTLVDRNDETITVISQSKLNKTDTVYNFTVDEFHTYHIGDLGVWVHNACGFNIKIANTADEVAFIKNAQSTFKNSKIWTGITRHKGDLVIQRSDIPLSKQNLILMKNGNAPFVKGNNGQWVRVELHHVGRKTGRVIEVRSDLHNYNQTTGGVLHIPGSGSPVRESTSSYWKQRYLEFINK